MDILNLAPPRYIAHTMQTGQINASVKLIRHFIDAMSALTDLLHDRDKFPQDLDPVAFSVLIDSMMGKIGEQVGYIEEYSMAIDKRARLAGEKGDRYE